MKREPTEDKNIFRYETGVYYYRKGNKEISLKVKTFRDAVRVKNSLLAKADPSFTSNLRLTFGKLVDDYLESRKQDVKLEKIRQSTYDETYMVLGKHIEPYFRAIAVAKIRTAEWNEYVSRKDDIDLTNHRKIMAHFLKWAMMHDYIYAMPILPLPRYERRKRRILKAAEIVKLWDHAHGSLRLFISFALLMGMRRAEIMKLKWSSINLENKSVSVEVWTTKTKQRRVIPMSPVTHALLSARASQLKKRGSKTEWVFPNRADWRRHAVVSGLKTAWRTCKLKAGFAGEDMTWHDLRATCEYYAHKRLDVTATQLEKFFGSSVDVQRKIYVSMDADDLRGLENSLSVK